MINIMMFDIILHLFSFLFFLVFLAISFLDIKRKGDFSRTVFLISLFFTFLSFLGVAFYFSNLPDINMIMIFFNFLITSTLLLYLLVCLIDFSFIKLRFFFTPYFFIVIVIFNLSFLDKFPQYDLNIFDNKLLSFHIILSLLAYSCLSIAAFSSLSIFSIQKRLKTSNQKKSLFFNLLPSIYESEKITIKLLYTTQFFLLLSLVSGFIYSSEVVDGSSYFLNEKSLLSIMTFFLICTLLLIRFFFGITGKKVFNIVLLSYLFINLSYFGIKLLR